MIRWSLWFLFLGLYGAKSLERLGPIGHFRKGVSAYLEERWQDCIEHLEASVEVRRKIDAAIVDCKVRCDRSSQPIIVDKEIMDLQFYEKMLRRTLCFMQCKRSSYPDVSFEYTSDSDMSKAMKNLDLYSYLQICYYQEKDLQKAASAAYTYLSKHPNDTTSKLNLEYYLKIPGIKRDEIVDHELEEYYRLYLKGNEAYLAEDWQNTIGNMEEAIGVYMAADERCRALCEGPYDQGWFPDFTTSVSNHFTYCLQCKQSCPYELQPLNGLAGLQLLADIYNHLQFAYFKLGRKNDAAQCVTSYLLIYPTDEDMLHNKKLYWSRDSDDSMFTPRPEIVYYMTRNRYENRLLKFIDKSFTFESELQDAKESDNSVETNNVIQ